MQPNSVQFQEGRREHSQPAQMIVTRPPLVCDDVTRPKYQVSRGPRENDRLVNVNSQNGDLNQIGGVIRNAFTVLL